MDSTQSSLNAHESPPASIKGIFKKYQKLAIHDIDNDLEILDFNEESCLQELVPVRKIDSSDLSEILSTFNDFPIQVESSKIYSHRSLPGKSRLHLLTLCYWDEVFNELAGLLIVPSLIPLASQKVLVSRLIHRELPDSQHNTNVHLHYDLMYYDGQQPGSSQAGYEQSFFNYSPSSDVKFLPKDITVHKPISVSKFLNKSLRWVTLGGQYNWTEKVYPDEQPPRFPSDIARLLGNLFPEMIPEAAIVNFYSPGDTLSLHRDVSEKVDKGLVSISIGCDCLFVIGLSSRENTVVIRLRSGDAVYMSREARFAWHGVPKILAQTCPKELQDWPAEGNGDRFEDWRGWMKGKRINLNVRQMFDRRDAIGAARTQ